MFGFSNRKRWKCDAFHFVGRFNLDIKGAVKFNVGTKEHDCTISEQVSMRGFSTHATVEAFSSTFRTLHNDKLLSETSCVNNKVPLDVTFRCRFSRKVRVHWPTRSTNSILRVRFTLLTPFSCCCREARANFVHHTSMPVVSRDSPVLLSAPQSENVRCALFEKRGWKVDAVLCLTSLFVLVYASFTTEGFYVRTLAAG